MRLIKFRELYPFYINPEHVASLDEFDCDNGRTDTRIGMKGGNSFMVRMEIDEVAKILIGES